MELPEVQSLFSAASGMQTGERYLPILTVTSGVLCMMFAEKNQNAVGQGQRQSKAKKGKARKHK